MSAPRPRLAPDQKKDVRVTICLTRPLAERVAGAAASAGVSRSEFVEAILRRECEEVLVVEDAGDGSPGRGVVWRSRMGLA